MSISANALTVHPMVPLERAVKLLKVGHSELEQKLVSAEIIGEQRSNGNAHGQKNSWFIYASEFDKLLNDQLADYEKRISTTGLEQLFEKELSQVEILEAKVAELVAEIADLSAEIEYLRAQTTAPNMAKVSPLSRLWQRAAKLCRSKPD